jgi:serine phosphatase RsbU (regulator of sigma subunit)
MAKLFVRTPGKQPFVVELTKMRMTVGRSVRNDICLEDPFSSRVHAELRCEGESCWLTDLGSANGTFVNGVRVTGTVQLFPGDRVQIGESLMEVQAAAGMTLATSATIIGERVPTEEVIATPETTLSSADRVAVAPDLLSVIETVRSVGTAEQPTGIERSKELLGVISQVGNTLLSQQSLDEVLHQIVGLVLGAVPADRAFLLLRESGEGDLVCKVASYRGREPSKGEQAVKISRSITEEVIGRGKAVLTSDALSDARFRQRESIILSGVRSIMAVPLSVNKQVTGMIYVDSPMNVNCFTDDDLGLLTMIASVAAIKVENALLVEQRIDNERIKQQLNNARDLQFRLLPVTPPTIENYDLTGISFPCYEVGGDYFDFIRLKEGNLGIGLGDVSGKGMDAAMLMSSLHASVRGQALTRAPIREMVGTVNRYIYETTMPNKFVTFFYGELNPQTHQLTYTNAGHNPPLLIRSDGQVDTLEAGGIPLGIVDEMVYEEGRVQFGPGDLMIIYSDGFSESVNELGEEFGVTRLIEVVRKHRHLKATQVRDRIDEAISQFIGKAHPADDMTLVIVKRLN